MMPERSIPNEDDGGGRIDQGMPSLGSEGSGDPGAEGVAEREGPVGVTGTKHGAPFFPRFGARIGLGRPLEVAGTSTNEG